jgi:hypothetical protein
MSLNIDKAIGWAIKRYGLKVKDREEFIHEVHTHCLINSTTRNFSYVVKSALGLYRQALKARKSFPLVERPYIPSYEREAEARDLWDYVLKGGALLNREKSYFRLKLEGLNDTEVSKRLGVSRQYVSIVKRTAFERAREILAQQGEGS